MATVKQKLEDDYIKCQSPQTLNNDIRFLLNLGSDLNLIKLPALKNEVMVYENTIYKLKGITEHCIHT